ncbi:MAG: alpha/beta hydrolase protein [Rhizobacter sp.]|nr:alpha/beta hydrolase protein [Rhizobacter sp.]
MRDLLDRIARANRPPFHSMPPAEARKAYDAAAGVLDLAKVALPRIESLAIPARDGHAMRACLFAPQAASADKPLPVMLYLHGGGFTIGGIAAHEGLCRRLAAESGAAVVALEYRLAPEHRFPTAVEDCFDALTWLAENAASLSLDGSRLAVGGDSAGGTLAAVMAIMARDAGLPLALQLLITPGATAYADTESHRRFANGFLLDHVSIEWFFGHYIDWKDRADWRFAPLEADDVDGVAPACVLLAECDPLVDEGLLYADKLRAAGVPVELELYRGVTHDFMQMGRAIPEALPAQHVAAAALRAAFASH